MDKKLLGKIQKLLALAADNPDSPESKSAAEKAAQLMADNNIGYEDVDQNGNLEDSGIDEIRVSANVKQHQAWESCLSSVLCRIFECERLVENFGGDNKKRVFIGARSDVQILSWMFKYLRLRIAKAAEDKFSTQRDQREFGLGVINTLTPRLDEMYAYRKKAQEDTTSALMAVGKGIAVKNHFHTKYPNLTTKKHSTKAGNRAAWQSGQQAGSTISLNQQVG